MIEVFLPNNTDYSKNGDMVLIPNLCTVEAGINEPWVFNLEHHIDSLDRWSYIKEDGRMRVPSFNGDQLFTINKVVKTDSGIRVVAEPSFMESGKDLFIKELRIVNKSGAEALPMIFNTPKYIANSNITKKASAYYYLQNGMDCINNSDNGFIKRWGGEILFDNYSISINDRIGSDNGVELLYGKNIKLNGLNETIDMTNIVTRIVPKAYKGYILPGNSPWVDSPNINKYNFVRYKVIEYLNVRLADDVDESSEDTEGLIICETMEELYEALRTVSMYEFENEEIDKPSIKIDCKMVLLQNAREYEYFRNLETVTLGDTVYCIHDRLKISTKARVTGLVWDCISNALQEVTITG